MKNLLIIIIMTITGSTITVPSYAVSRTSEAVIVQEKQISKRKLRKERRKRIKEQFEKGGKALYIILGFAALGAAGGMLKLLLFSLMRKILWLSILSGMLGVVFLIFSIALFVAPMVVTSI